MGSGVTQKASYCYDEQGRVVRSCFIPDGDVVVFRTDILAAFSIQLQLVHAKTIYSGGISTYGADDFLNKFSPEGRLVDQLL